MEFKKYLHEVEGKLRSLTPQIPKEVAFNYIGGKVSKLEFLGLKVPQVKAVYREGFSFLKEGEEKVAEVWNYIWHNSNIYEAMSLSIHWFSDKNARKDLAKHWPRLKSWADRIDNWAHSDSLSDLYSAILEANPKVIQPTLKEWSESVNPWLRRQSMVSLLYYSSLRKKVPPLSVLLTHVKKQLDFDHYYVQKGVGWTLREISNLHPNEAVEFLKKNFDRVSATAFSAAVEKLSPKQKEYLKGLRKSSRKSFKKEASAAKVKIKKVVKASTRALKSEKLTKNIIKKSKTKKPKSKKTRY